ncbi:hypothetical protein [Streptomyces sp. NPDC088254]|uniref:hypothetical protein n=1 Tax=Streptomyces sp. NPDC088254 TaxID=3365847 RepID=UPI0038101B88
MRKPPLYATGEELAPVLGEFDELTATVTGVEPIGCPPEKVPHSGRLLDQTPRSVA